MSSDKDKASDKPFILQMQHDALIGISHMMVDLKNGFFYSVSKDFTALNKTKLTKAANKLGTSVWLLCFHTLV